MRSVTLGGELLAARVPIVLAGDYNVVPTDQARDAAQFQRLGKPAESFERRGRNLGDFACRLRRVQHRQFPRRPAVPQRFAR
jgi:hypothetical protein